MVKLGKYARGVSIIGVGNKIVNDTIEHPEYAHLSEGQMFGHAAVDAMEDAGIEAKDIDFFIHGQGVPWIHHAITPSIHVADWFGMKGKPSIHHSEACCTGYVGLDLAVSYVASGKYDIVLSGVVEAWTPAPLDCFKPPHIRKDLPMDQMMLALAHLEGSEYSRHMAAGHQLNWDNWISSYKREYNLTWEQIDDMINAQSYYYRRNAVRNPLSVLDDFSDYDEIAEDEGYADGWEYLRSDDNPHLSQILRGANFAANILGAGALIVCPTEIAHKFRQEPIEVLGIGHTVLDFASNTHMQKKGTAEVARQVYELTGLKPDDIDLLITQDFMGESIMVAEEVGYIPRGEGWKYAKEGRIAFDGDKPINTHGGNCFCGGGPLSGMSSYYEVAMQMRGQAGDRQVKKADKVFVRGYGGGQNFIGAILGKSK